MKTCEVCDSKIPSNDIYFDVVIWEMVDGEGCEVADITMCQRCKDDKVTQ